MIDLYCERVGPGLLAEPLNALTNLAFFVAAWAVWKLSDKHSRSGDIILLITLLVMIGAGSALFHTFATSWAEMLDVFPILFFQIAYIWIYSRRIIGLPLAWTGGLLVIFFTTVLVCGLLPGYFNNSINYAPAFIFLVGLGIYHYYTNKNEKSILFAAAGLFLLSLTFRSIDLLLCPYFPIGTHFMWHILNGAVLYLSIRAVLVNQLEPR